MNISTDGLVPSSQEGAAVGIFFRLHRAHKSSRLRSLTSAVNPETMGALWPLRGIPVLWVALKL